MWMQKHQQKFRWRMMAKEVFGPSSMGTNTMLRNAEKNRSGEKSAKQCRGSNHHSGKELTGTVRKQKGARVLSKSNWAT